MQKLLYYLYSYSGRIVAITWLIGLFIIIINILLTVFQITISLSIFCLTTGVALGWAYHKLATKYISNFEKFKAKAYYEKYKKNVSLKSLEITLKNLVFQFSIRNKNKKAFLLNVKVADELVIQMMHRSFFPELCESELDKTFGIAVYIPHDTLELMQKLELDRILKEYVNYKPINEKNIDYTVLDIGTNLQLGSFIIALILKEVFKLVDDSYLSYELFDEGTLPFPNLKDI